MERILSQEDRIRRAEEIYFRKNNINSGKTATLNTMQKKEHKLFGKTAIQLLICISIYMSIYFLGAKPNSFSTDLVGNIKRTLCYDVDVEEYINLAKKFILEKMPKTENETKIQQEEIMPQEETLAVEDTNENIQEEINQEMNQESIQDVTQDTSSISQMEQDAEYIKANFSLIKPVVGTITSRFGLRNPTTATVPKYHTGIDIAVNEGTVFIASMEGTVEKVSSQGDYRKSCKNYKW